MAVRKTGMETPTTLAPMRKRENQASGLDGGIDADGHREEHDDDGGGEDQFKGGRGLAQNDLHGRPFVEVRHAEIAVEGALQETTPLDQEGVVEAQLAANIIPLLGRDAHAGQLPHGIAERVLDGEPDAADDQHDHEGLDDAADDEGEHYA